MAEVLPLLYTQLADWFHLLTAPDEYAEEAEFYFRALSEATGAPPRTLLELGSGGGNNASHYKRYVQSATLVDLSEGMLELSQRLNPECEHIQGDMRDVRLGRVFDAVFVHDAVCHLTTEDELRQAMQTAFVHCRPGGAALFAPDHTRENFDLAHNTEHGGRDGNGRALRYVEWTFDPDPSDTTYLSEFAYLLHEDGQSTRCLYDRHVYGLFSRADWLRLLTQVGFAASVRPFEHSEVPPGSLEVFVGIKPSEERQRG
jgi:SAM-dependent methyltransferase